MHRKRLMLLGLLAVAALTVAGVAAAHGSRPSAQTATATFTATTVSNLQQAACSVNGGDTYQVTTATYSGTAVSTDTRLAGTLTIRARSIVDTTTGVGHVRGVFRIRGTATAAHGEINAAISNGQAAGLARGEVRHPSGRLIASLGSTFDPSTGFASGSLGAGSTTGAGVVLVGGWCQAPGA
jgi:hypothetical protein